MLSINTNLSSLIAQSSMKQSTNKLNQAIERMTTGFKINHASDNAANYSISTNMTTKIGAYDVAEDNAAMGLDLISTAEGTLNQIQDKLERLRALQEQASNGTYGEQSLNAINAEANALVDELERLYQTAEYNGIKLFAEKIDPANGNGVTGSFIKDIDQLTPDEATAQGYTIIRTADELQNMTSAGKYILMNDIDLSGYEWTPINNFSGELNGNGYVVKNLKTNEGFFKFAEGIIKNLGMIDSIIDDVSNTYDSAGILVNDCNNISIENCYSTGTISVSHSACCGGLIGYLGLNSTVSHCYSSANVIAGGYYTGGLIGSAESSIEYCYATGNVTNTGNGYVGGLIGNSYYTTPPLLLNSYSTGKVSSSSSDKMGGGIGFWRSFDDTKIKDLYWDIETSETNIGIAEHQSTSGNTTDEAIGVTSAELKTLINNGTLVKAKEPVIMYKTSPEISLQVGINNNSNSQLTIGLSFNLDNTKSLRKIGIDSSDFLEQIDNLLSAVSQKQAEYGAVSNRLESVLEEITIQRDNLVSSRSTIRDADIAEVSSQYIQQQILQQASATLLATANQSPAIALQLI